MYHILRQGRWLVVVTSIIALLAMCAVPDDPADPPAVASPAAGKAANRSILEQPQAPARLVVQPTASPNMPDASPTPRLKIEETATPAPLPSPTPTPALRQLTTGGCCTQPFWSADSQRVLFIDRPAPDVPVGIWGVNVAQPKSSPELVTNRIGYYTADFEFLIDLQDDATIIERLDDGARWAVPTGGRPVTFSPSRKLIAWEVSNDAPFERRVTQVWVANLDGSDARIVTEIRRGGLSGWISDNRLLLSGHDTFQSQEQVLYTFSLSDGQATELARARRLRGSLLSPDGDWLAYFITFDEDPAQNGLWLMRTDGSERRKLDLELFGAYQWRDARRLLIVPFRPDAVSHSFWEYDLETDEARGLAGPEAGSFKIANGDWIVSPNGRHVAFVESRDDNIWVLTLPD